MNSVLMNFSPDRMFLYCLWSKADMSRLNVGLSVAVECAVFSPFPLTQGGILRICEFLVMSPAGSLRIKCFQNNSLGKDADRHSPLGFLTCHVLPFS